jgi:hypothetical protein
LALKILFGLILGGNMSIAIEQAVGRYIYGIIRASEAPRIDADVPSGLNDAELSVIEAGAVAAIVSPSEICRLRPQRKLLAAHQNVVDWISKRCSLLPVAFGLIADSEDDVQGLLVKHQEVLSNQLDVVDGRVEMTVTLSWAVENIFQFFVDRHQDLKDARESLASGSASRDQLIAVGQLFERLQAEERENLSAKVIAGFENLSVEVENQAPKDETQIFRAAFLIAREDVQQFESQVYEIAKGFDENFSFSFNGPWPPYSFVKLNLASE